MKREFGSKLIEEVSEHVKVVAPSSCASRGPAAGW
jgi:hypothetical protein